MVLIEPFRGILYNNKKVPLAKAVAPPYDIISPADQQRFYALHHVNVIRLILGRQYAGDDKRRNRYKRAANFYKKWLKQKFLFMDAAPSIYIYKIEFREGGRKKTRLGFISLASLKADDGGVLPHEMTFSGPKKDRLNLLRACRTNFCQIFTLYNDHQKRIARILKIYMRGRPLIKVRYNGEGHSIWRLSNAETIRHIKNIMRKKKIFIADGHHRYEVARIFSREMEKRFGPRAFPGSRYAMLYFSDMDEKGLCVSATHRLLREDAVSADRIEGLAKFFKVIVYPYCDKSSFRKASVSVNKVLKKNKRSFGLLAEGKNELKVFVLKDTGFIKNFIRQPFSSKKKNLAVTILDEGVLKGFLKIKDFEKDISYTRDIEDAKKKLDEGRFSAAFLLPPTTLSELKGIVRSGERMPHKSTYFYPKLLSGLVIYDQERSV